MTDGCKTRPVDRAADSFPRVERLDTLLDALPEAIVRPAWAHMSLRMTDWAIRHFPPSEVTQWLDLAEQRIG